MADEDKDASGGGGCSPDCKCNDCDYDSKNNPFIATTVEPFDRFNSKSVMMDCGDRGIIPLSIPRYLATNFHFEKDNMVPSGKNFVVVVCQGGELAVVSIYEG